MRTALLLLALAAGALMAPVRGHAQAPQLPPPAPFPADLAVERPLPVESPWSYPTMDVDRGHLENLVRARRFDDAGVLLQGYRDKVLQDIRWEEHLVAAYASFYGPERDLGPLLEEWVARSPESAASRLARAEFFLARTWEARGGGRSSTIGSAQWKAVNAYRRKALDDAAAAVALDPDNLAAHDIMLRALIFGGWSARSEDALATALEHFPDSYAIRWRALSGMRPRWGGSYERMNRLAEEAQASVSRNPRLRVLLMSALLEQARTLREADKYPEALEMLDRVDTDQRDWEFHYDRGRVWTFARDPVRAMAEYDQAIALRPHSFSTLEARGRALARIAQRIAPAERRVEILTAAEADLVEARALQEADTDLGEWVAWVSSRKVACAETPATCFPPRSEAEQAAPVRPPPPSGVLGWVGRVVMFVLGIPYTLWLILRQLQEARVGPAPWLALGIIAWSFLEWRRQRYWTPTVVHVMAGLAVLMIIAINAAWLSVGGTLWTQRIVVVVICGLVPYVVYLLFLGPRLLGRRRTSAQEQDPRYDDPGWERR